MKMNIPKNLMSLCFCLIMGLNTLHAQNPLIMDQFTADPTARVFEGRVYVYPSHDIRAEKGKGRPGWFCMPDYHVFSSQNLTEWTDHGVIVSQNHVAWVDSNAYSMWAPDCYEKNGKYYFYFPAIADSSTGIRGMGIGVAVSDKPYGPFIPEPLPIKGVSGIDPNVFIDKDGQGYLYWAGFRGMRGAKLKGNMMELATEPQIIDSLPKGMKEGPFLFERNGIYYFTFPHVIEETEALVYGMGDHPLGPFEYKGIIMDEHTSGCWTNHHSVLEYKNQWYLFYHHNDLSPHFDKNRSIRADSLFFNEDGTIQKVIPSRRGVGLTRSTEKIQTDRYSAISPNGAAVAFLDTSNTFAGWKSVLDSRGAWIQYNSVDFNQKKLKSVYIRACSEAGGFIQIRINHIDGPLLAEIKIPKTSDWKVLKTRVKSVPSGIHHLFVVLTKSGPVEFDWIKFE